MNIFQQTFYKQYLMLLLTCFHNFFFQQQHHSFSLWCLMLATTRNLPEMDSPGLHIFKYMYKSDYLFKGRVLRLRLGEHQ